MPQSENPCQVLRLDHLVLTVTSIPQTIRFYTDILGMHAETFSVADGSKRHALFFGQTKINLHQHFKEFTPKAAQPTPGSADLCFITDATIESWCNHLATHRIVIEEGPIARTGATGPLLSIYVRDPDSNLIEISTVGPN